VDGKYITGHSDDKAAGVLDLNLGSIPILYVDGKAVLGQSRAIERFLSKQFGLMGSSDIEAGQVDMWTEHVRDVLDKYQKAKASGGDDGAAKWMAEDLPDLLKKLEKVIALTSTAPGCTVGGKLSLADVKLYMAMADYFDEKYKETVMSAVKEHAPHIAAVVDSVGSHEKVKAWLAERPVTPF
jgi:prostaglandin-H2 D-isomerase / glutathione transferase